MTKKIFLKYLENYNNQITFVSKYLLMIRKSTDTRQEEIKKAFLNIIYRDGLKKLSTRNLAREVGISEGAIFRHFASKNDIILAIINDVQQDMIEELRIITLESGSPA